MKLNYPDSLTIRHYHEGRLDPKKMHQLEKQALDDPFLWEALEGYAHSADPGADLSILQRQLHKRIVHLQENKKVFDLTWQRLSIAAAAAVLFISAGILFWMNSNKSGTELASNQKHVEVAVIDRDSLSSVIHSTESSAAAQKIQSVPSSDSRVSPDQSPENLKDGGRAAPAAIKTDPAFNTSDPATSETKLSARSSASRDVQVSADPSDPIARESFKESGVQPVPGWDIYRRYLQDNIRRPEPQISGTVYLSFEVNPEGRPVNINVLIGLNKAYNAEAIRLLKDGPSWKTREGSEIRTGRVEVKF